MGSWDLVGQWVMRALSYGVVAVSSLAAMTLIAAAAPGFLRRERRAARSGMRRCFLWGAVFVVNCILVAALLAMDGMIGKVIALIVMVALLVISLAGLAAIACEVGSRVLLLAERESPSVLARITTGSAVVFTTAVIPVFGWLVLAGALLTGIGAFLETAVEDYRPTRQRRPAATFAAEGTDAEAITSS